MKTINELKLAIENDKAQSAWAKGVKAYALELVEKYADNYGDNAEFYGNPANKKELLNGASNWHEYSEGGCSLIYDCDIAERTCNPTELKKTKGGDNAPNSRESWLDVQARALKQAERMICRLAK